MWLRRSSSLGPHRRRRKPRPRRAGRRGSPRLLRRAPAMSGVDRLGLPTQVGASPPPEGAEERWEFSNGTPATADEMTYAMSFTGSSTAYLRSSDLFSGLEDSLERTQQAHEAAAAGGGRGDGDAREQVLTRAARADSLARTLTSDLAPRPLADTALPVAEGVPPGHAQQAQIIALQVRCCLASCLAGIPSSLVLLTCCSCCWLRAAGWRLHTATVRTDAVGARTRGQRAGTGVPAQRGAAQGGGADTGGGV